jgi:hypothetical protein
MSARTVWKLPQNAKKKKKKIEEIHDTSSSRNLFKTKCLFSLSELAYKYCGLFAKV